jgi:hypothetical protein
MATKKDKQRKMMLEARKRCDQRKFESGLIRKSIWVPAQFEQNLMDFVRQLTEMHEVNMSNKRA